MSAKQWLENKNEQSMHYIPLDDYGRVYTEAVVIQLLNEYKQPEDTGIIGKMFFVEAPNFEGDAEVLSVNDDDTVRVRSDWAGAIYTVDQMHLTQPAA